MGDLSKNFSLREFRCKGTNCCNHAVSLSPTLLKTLQEIRDILGEAMIVNCGYRCRTHNEEIGGAIGSLHTMGMAADIKCPSADYRDKLVKIASSHPYVGYIGIHDEFVHIDVRRGDMLVQDKRSNKNAKV